MARAAAGTAVGAPIEGAASIGDDPAQALGAVLALLLATGWVLLDRCRPVRRG